MIHLFRRINFLCYQSFQKLLRLMFKDLATEYMHIFFLMKMLKAQCVTLTVIYWREIE